ncbi:MAG: serine--tRNA ligase [Candidatus Izemoplasmatales bacterium]|jgi:seryl-tRNA synthetase|nr:serine--tRNA ligase [Candidatus Izemoplasmatales bacterium]
MLDIELIVSNPEGVEKALAKRGFEVDFKGFIELREKRNALLRSIEEIRALRNKLSKSIGEYKREKKDTAELFQEIEKIKNAADKDEESLNKIEEEINEFLLKIPNIPDEDLLAGEKENNVVVSVNKDQPVFDFEIKDHVELATSLGLVDYERAAKISGRGTWMYTNLGARLEWALINFFIDEHLKDGYEFMMVPHLLNYESGQTAGQFPKFKEDVFWLEGESPKKFLLPTAETALINVHRNEILELKQLPRKYFSYTPCYRREAGSYRSEERGMIRGYQFNKVEMVQFTTPDDSDDAFLELMVKAETLMKKLGLHYQVSKLAAGDVSFAMARTFDIEVWLPSIKIYKEVSSVSNSRSFQARRGMIRYRTEQGKIDYVHTLNGSGLATSRLLPAILEQNQNADGSVNIPEVLVPYLGGIKVLKKVK